MISVGITLTALKSADTIWRGALVAEIAASSGEVWVVDGTAADLVEMGLARWFDGTAKPAQSLDTIMKQLTVEGVLAQPRKRRLPLWALVYSRHGI